ncbi:MAG: hypothetical protein ABI333_02190 [bacterium]
MYTSPIPRRIATARIAAARPAHARIVALAALLSLAGGPAEARRSSKPQGRKTSPPTLSPTAPAPRPPSPDMRDALRAYERRDYHGATVLLHRVLTGTRDGVETKMRAGFFLGKALYHLKLYAPALSYFEKVVTAGASHKYYHSTLLWLASLQRKLGPAAGVLGQIGRYPAQALEAPLVRPVRHFLRYCMGRYHFGKGDAPSLRRSVQWLRRVGPQSPWFAKARLLEGIAQTRLRRMASVLEPFHKVLRHARTSGRRDAELARLGVLARLNMARVFYEAGGVGLLGGPRDDRSERALRPKAARRMLRLAVKYYDSIPATSRHWPQALFEQSWALFLSATRRTQELKRSSLPLQQALTNLQILTARFPNHVAAGEAGMLEAIVLFLRCRFHAAGKSLKRLDERLRPLSKGLRQLLRKYPDPLDFYKLAVKIRRGGSPIPAPLAVAARTALRDVSVSHTFEYVKNLQRQLKRFEAAPAAWKTTAVASWVQTELTLLKSLVTAQAGTKARFRIKRAVDDLGRVLLNVSSLQFEVNAIRTDRTGRGIGRRRLPSTRTTPRDRSLPSAGGGELSWPMTGSYWQEELRYHRYHQTNRCPATPGTRTGP